MKLLDVKYSKCVLSDLINKNKISMLSNCKELQKTAITFEKELCKTFRN